MNAPSGKERRRYIRLKTVFPVLFQVISEDKTTVLSQAYQGFTKDISASGMCIRVTDLKKSLIDIIKTNKNCKLKLIIEMPFFMQPISAVGSVVWMKQSSQGQLEIYMIGIEYDEILRHHQRRIIRRVKLMRDIPKVVGAGFGIMLVLVGFLAFREYRLKEQNSALIGQLQTKSYQEYRLKQELSSSSSRLAELKKELSQTGSKLDRLSSEISRLKTNNQQVVEELTREYSRTLAAESELEQSLARIKEENELLRKRLMEVEEGKVVLEERVLDVMYHYIRATQNKTTGLIPSFRGDAALKEAAFTYDEALAASLFIIKGDIEEAARILDFYKDKAARRDNVFYNAYFASGGDVSEYNLHAGPNVFIALAAIEYYQRTGNKEYLPLAKDIAGWLISLQKQNNHGGVKGGPDVSWISTEHNLDIYALMDRLYELSGDKKYKESRDSCLDWLLNHGFNKGVHGFNRGHRDAHVATDANLLSILAIGPAALYERGIDAERILEYIEKKCLVEVEYRRPDDTVVVVAGFDFTNPGVARRKPVVSCEWTAQAVVAYKIMGDYFRQHSDQGKANYYFDKADYYLTQLEKVAIAKGGVIRQKGIGLPLVVMALPYASREGVDTGHGWFTPQGAQTTSICATIYTIYAHLGYNYLRLNQVENEPKM